MPNLVSPCPGKFTGKIYHKRIDAVRMLKSFHLLSVPPSFLPFILVPFFHSSSCSSLPLISFVCLCLCLSLSLLLCFSLIILFFLSFLVLLRSPGYSLLFTLLSSGMTGICHCVQRASSNPPLLLWSPPIPVSWLTLYSRFHCSWIMTSDCFILYVFLNFWPLLWGPSAVNTFFKVAVFLCPWLATELIIKTVRLFDKLQSTLPGQLLT